MEHRSTSAKIGIIGDGQLALMLAEALMKINTPFLCLSTSQESPMQACFGDFITSDTQRFRSECDVFTLENEFHTIPELHDLLQVKSGKLFPEINSYNFFADKISQRRFYESAGISGPKWMPLRNINDLQVLSEKFQYPFVIKASKGGYDGKGVRIVNDHQELEKVLKDFKFAEGNFLLAEEKVQIQKEVAQGFLRASNGQFTILPLVETIQENGVCNLVHYPSKVNDHIQGQIDFFLERLIASGLVGIFNFEFFVDMNNRVLINEGAPRTHNSQHLTLDASPLSQFDLLALYLTDPTHAPRKMTAKPSVMINILGKRTGPCGELKLPEFSSVKVSVKLYGKAQSSPGRKMGHVNVVDDEGKTDLLAVGKRILKEYDL